MFSNLTVVIAIDSCAGPYNFKFSRRCDVIFMNPYSNVFQNNSRSIFGGPVGRGYEQRLESKNAYEQRSESKIEYGPRAKLRTVQEQKRAGAESKNAYELRVVIYWI